MKQIEIRELSLEDICNESDNGFYLALNELSDEKIKISLDKAKIIFYNRQYSGIRTLVATIDDYIVGTLSILLEEKFLHDGSKIAHIEEVSINEKYQRTGIGKMLIQEAIKIAEDSGCYKAVLHCDESKMGFYEKMGFYSVNGMRIDLPIQK